MGDLLGDDVVSAKRDSGLVFEIGLVLAMYAAFIIAYLLFKGFFNLVFVQYLTIATVVPATLLLFYKAYVKKQIVMFISGFTVIGILLLTMATIITVPFTTTETIPSTYSYNWYDNTIALNPTESKSISLHEHWPSPVFAANGTVVQLKFSNTGGLRIKLYYRHFLEQTLGLNESFGTSAVNASDLGKYWFNIYWAPIGPIDEGPNLDTNRGDIDYDITVNLENREDTFQHVILKVDLYDFAGTTEEEFVRYRPAVDYYFGYLGVALLITAVVLELFAWQKGRIRSPILQNKTTHS